MRAVGRVGGASAGVIAVLFGVLEQLKLTPPAWIPITLGALAILGVLTDYGVEKRNSEATTDSPKQSQKLGPGSTGFVAGRDNRDIDVTKKSKPSEDEL